MVQPMTHEAEAVPVQLTRMEGVLNLVLERTTMLNTRMDKVEDRASSLEATTQRLDLDAQARDKTAVALALALKEAKEAVEATARAKSAEVAAEAFRTEKAWSPWAKVITVMVGAAGIASVILAYFTG